ncbi:hypothetical protein LX87_03197 [Larkinella arboricola]|uniref:Uncharacterized protein n=1 Tax=Larkinella arboricola TaxID=643671 RepID=A0A327WUQ9_LARAB|nr:hypothetical protein LX87_03197 [Larkinella arboricola]
MMRKELLLKTVTSYLLELLIGALGESHGIVIFVLLSSTMSSRTVIHTIPQKGS